MRLAYVCRVEISQDAKAWASHVFAMAATDRCCSRPIRPFKHGSIVPKQHKDVNKANRNLGHTPNKPVGNKNSG